jgi:hypothetical protein
VSILVEVVDRQTARFGSFERGAEVALRLAAGKVPNPKFEAHISRETKQ